MGIAEPREVLAVPVVAARVVLVRVVVPRAACKVKLIRTTVYGERT